MKTSKDFKVAIVGGGVCGLTCAVALAREGVPVQLFEAAVCVFSPTLVNIDRCFVTAGVRGSGSRDGSRYLLFCSPRDVWLNVTPMNITQDPMLSAYFAKLVSSRRFSQARERPVWTGSRSCLDLVWVNTRSFMM